MPDTPANFPWELLLTDYHTVTLYGQRRRPLSGDECTWQVTLVRNVTQHSHDKRMGEGDTPAEALSDALASDAALIKNVTKRRKEPAKTPGKAVSMTAEARRARRAALAPKRR